MKGNVLNTTATAESEMSRLLEEYDPYILTVARSKVPTTLAHPALLHLETDELAQCVRIKLWQTLRHTRILNMRAYINCIVYTESITMMRRYKPTYALPENDDGEIYAGCILITSGEGMQDPAIELENEEKASLLLERVVDAAIVLPPRQQRAFICELKGNLKGVLPLAEAFRKKGTDISIVNWPEDKEDRTRLKASLSEARKKLSFLMSAKCRYSANC